MTENESRVEDLVREARAGLRDAPFDAPPREAALLLAHALGWTEVQVLTRSRDSVPPEDQACFRSLLARRLAGEPMAYLKGEREFYGRPFAVDRRVLIPRPETEHLVEAAMEKLRRHPSAEEPPVLLDVGTGSGCIAVTLDLELRAAGTEARVVATDRSPGALAVARANARRHASRATFLWTDLADGVDLGSVTGIVSNPPYLAPAEAETMSVEVKDFEPRLALFADREGFAVLDRLLALRRRLRAGTWLALEIGSTQHEAACRKAHEAGWNVDTILQDLAGHPRVLIVTA